MKTLLRFKNFLLKKSLFQILFAIPIPMFCCVCFLTNTAQAQEFDFNKVPVLKVNPDFNGVDPASGSYSTASPLSFSAPAAGHLDVQTSFNGRRQSSSLNIYLSDNTYRQGAYASSTVRHIVIHLGGIDRMFTCDDIDACTQDVHLDGASLTRVTTDNYVFKDKLGTIYTFFPLAYQQLPTCIDLDSETGCNAAVYAAYAYISTIVYPSGEKLTYLPYTSVTTSGSQKYAKDTIQSNLGYKIVFESVETSSYSPLSMAGYNWFRYRVGDIPPKMMLYRGTELINTLSRTNTWSANNEFLTVTQKDDLNRTYAVKFKSGIVKFCGRPAGAMTHIYGDDHTPLLPVSVQLPSGQSTSIAYHMDSSYSGYFKEAAGKGTNIPVKTITRADNSWTYDNIADRKTLVDPYLKTRSVDYAWLYNNYDYGPPGSERIECPDSDPNIASTKITSYTDELSHRTNYSYVEDLLDIANLPEQNGYDYDYDARGNLTAITQLAKPSSGMPNRVVFRASYAATCTNPLTCNKPDWVQNAKGIAQGFRTDYTYDPTHGGVLTVTQPAQPNGVRPVTTYSYTPTNTGDGTIWRQTGSSLCTTDSNCSGQASEVKTVTRYWGNSFLPETKTVQTGDNSLAATESFIYNNQGHVTEATDPMGQKTYNFYDVVGRKIGTISPDPDGAGPLPRLATRITYNDGDQPLTIETGTTAGTTLPELKSMSVINWVENVYDPLDRKTKETKFANSAPYGVTQYSYDAWNRPICTAVRMNLLSQPTDACVLGALGQYGYDRITKNEYDDAGQLKKIYRAYGTQLQQTYAVYSYSDNGKQTAVTDANNNISKLVYDGYDRQTYWYFPSKTKGSLISSNTDYEQYGYDLNDNRNTYRRRNGAIINYEYDDNNRLTSKIFSDKTKQKDVYYGYDLRGLMLYARFDSDNGEGITNTYDGFGNRVSSTNNMGSVTRTLTSEYDNNNNRVRLTHPSGWLLKYNFDGLNRVQAVTDNKMSSYAPWYLGISYKSNGRDRTISRLGGGSGTYKFNDLGQLESIEQSFLYEASSDIKNEFTYNPAGQVTTLTQSNTMYTYLGNENRTGTYVPDGLNRYATIAGQAMSYDGSSNLTFDGVQYYSYDDENRLTSTSAGGGVSLKYDPLGRLFQTTIAGNNTQFLYDGDALAAEYVNGVLSKSYAHGDQVDEPLFQVSGSNPFNTTGETFTYFVADHQGSIIGRAGQNGKAVQTIAYDVYGIPAIKNAAQNDRFAYTGQLWFKELGLYYYKARMYHPKLGRFLQTDPIGYKDDMNWYAYVGNDPVNKTDPTGEYAHIIYGGIAGAIGGFVASSGASLTNRAIATVAGGAAGAATGAAFAPHMSHLSGMAAGAAFAGVGAVSSVIGQSAGSVATAAITTGTVTIADVGNVSLTTTVASAVGAGVGGVLGASVATIPATESVIGSTVGSAVPNSVIGTTAGSIVEGVVGGLAEKLVTPPPPPPVIKQP